MKPALEKSTLEAVNAQLISPGFGFANFRSFGEEPQNFYPLGKMNILVGPNNSGKSNVLLFVRDYLNQCRAAISYGNNSISMTELCRPLDTNAELKFIHFVNDVDLVSTVIVERFAEQISKLKQCPEFFNNGKWRFEFELANTRLWPSEWLVNAVGDYLADAAWENMALSLTSSSAISNSAENVRSVLSRMLPDATSLNVALKIVFVPTLRGIQSGQNFDGQGGELIAKLQELERPSHNNQHLKKTFESINEFVRKVTGDSTAHLEIPSDKSSILVSMNNRLLPLQSLGTGIEQVIVLAAACTLESDAIICLEEPETNLHPTFQRQLISYLSEATTNQYLISTHSAHLMDLAGTTIFELSLKENRTVVSRIQADHELIEASRNLGTKPSDFLQVNCIIWVEGPSDRIYLNYWLSCYPDLVEKIHYSIMFYGGGLSRHLSGEFADEVETLEEDLICLRRLNSHAAFVMDSDRNDEADKINEDRQKLANQFNSKFGMSWITAGRTIENYLPQEQFGTIVRQKHSKTVFPEWSEDDKFTSIATRPTKKEGSVSIDKVACARNFIAAYPNPNLHRLDLFEKISELAQFIRSANHMQNGR